MPYPLPEGDAYTDVLRWFLVAVPDKPEYVRAALGAYTEFTKWYIWERDELKRGADAADAWDEAVAATLEALEMGFPDILLGHIDELEDLLRANQGGACCDDDFAVDQQTDPGGVIQPIGDPVGEDIVVGEGDPPGDVVDWPTYNSRLCDGATKFADGLAQWFDVLRMISQGTTILLAGAIAFLLPVMAGIGIVGASVAGALGFLTSLTFLDNLRTILGQGLPFTAEKAEVEDANTKQEVICAIVLASTPAAAASAVQSALNTHAPNAAPYVAWLPLTFFMGRIFNMESDAAAGFGGGCGDCEESFDIDVTFTFDADAEGLDPSGAGVAAWSPTYSAIYVRRNSGNNAQFTMSGADLYAKAGLSANATYKLQVVEFDLGTSDNDPGLNSLGNVRLRTAAQAGWETQNLQEMPATERIVLSDLAALADFLLTPTATVEIFQLYTVSGNAERFYIDNLRIAANVVP